MYRVMVVDDEEPVLESFAYMLEHHVQGFCLCAAARSGTEALQLVAETMPDVVFMDIHMPGMDGMETVRHIRRDYPHIVCILATAYERFDIARQAIPLGVFSYLVKPITRKMFVGELEKVGVHLQARRAHQSDSARQVFRSEHVRKAFVERFLVGIESADPEEDDCRQFREFCEWRGEDVRILLVEAGTQLAKERAGLLLGLLEDDLRFHFRCVTRRGPRRLVVLLSDAPDLAALESCLEQHGMNLPDSGICGAFGAPGSLEELGTSFAAALSGLHQLVSDGQEEDCYTRMIRICELFCSGDIRGAEGLFDIWREEVFERDALETARSRMVAFFTLLIDRVHNSIRSGIEGWPDPAPGLGGLFSLAECREWCTQSLAFLKRQMAERGNDNYPLPLIRALDLVHQGYGQQLTLADLARDCRVSAGYLSRLWSSHLHCSFVDYVNRYRVQKAIELFKEQNLSVKEVAASCGYTDANYFSRVFRKYTAATPSDFMRQEGLSCQK